MQESDLKDLLSKMSTSEKINQLLQLSANFYEGTADLVSGPRQSLGIDEQDVKEAGSVLMAVGARTIIDLQKRNLKDKVRPIPQLFMADIIHGCRTIFPIPLAQGCTFNPKSVQEIAEVAAKEAARAGVHVVFSPMVDLIRDPRWGRVMESTGEDPFLNSVLAKATIKGYQGENIGGKDKVAVCVKHFAAYGSPLGGREYGSVDISEIELQNAYLPAYKAGVDAGAKLIMTSFNTLNGLPMTCNKYMISEILKKKWGFEGLVISDWGAMRELVVHGVAADKKEAAFLSFDSGIDVDMVTDCYTNNLEQLVNEEKIKMSEIDKSVYRVLKLKNELGLFENPFKDADETYDRAPQINQVNRKIARKVTTESFVLLKNDGILPLPKQMNEKIKKIAFIGPYVDEKEICSAWAFFNNNTENITLKEGVLNKKVAIKTYFEPGCDRLAYREKLVGMRKNHINELSKAELSELENRAIEVAKKSDVVVLAIGEHYDYSGEAGSRTSIGIPEHQLELFRKIYRVNTNIIVLSFSGRPLDLREISQKARAILQVWLPGTEGGNAIADVLFGNHSPSGKLAMSFPYNVGQVPIYYNELTTGRPINEVNREQRFCSRYIDAPNQPLYPFGFGLSYGQFDYSKIQLDAHELTSDSKIDVKVVVTNVGNYTGQEVVQLYVHDQIASIARPVRELKGFKKIALQPGESETVVFQIEEEMLKFYNSKGKHEAETGKFDIFIGPDSQTHNKETIYFKKTS